MGEDNSRFEKRKQDHIKWSLDEVTQTRSLSQLDQIKLLHEALPEMNFEEVSTETSFFSHKLSVPFFVSSMTAGHQKSPVLNELLVSLSERKKILVGVGSQRKELWDDQASQEWKHLRQKYPKAILAGNLGLTQLIELMENRSDRWKILVEALQPQVFFIHTNPLQEVIQPEGTPHFKNGLKSLEKFIKEISLPVVLKEVGHGFSPRTLARLDGLGLAAVDVAGLGGTHWGRLEGARQQPEDLGYQVAQTFRDWGLTTLESVLSARKILVKSQIWASGGIRDGLDIAKMIALGAHAVGLAQPWMKIITRAETLNEIGLNSQLGSTERYARLSRIEKELDLYFERLEQELKVAMFCTGSQTAKDLRDNQVWTWSENGKVK